MKPTTITFDFVSSIPESLSEGVLYVCIPYATAVHLCLSGCGQEIVTPLSPTDWSVTFDGVSVSLSPSIGNWSLPCQSHYWIRNSRVHWAESWSKDEVDRGRRRDRQAKNKYFAADESTAPADLGVADQEVVRTPLNRIRALLRKLLSPKK